MASKVAFSPDIDALISAAESEHPGIPAGLLRAQLWRESLGNPTAVSHKGARGIAQVLDATAANPLGGLGVSIPPLRDSSNPRESIYFMARAMDALIKKHGDPDVALTVYNAGPGRANLPFDKLPSETKGYIRSINALASTIGGEDMSDDELGANAILRKYKVNSPYPQGAQLKGLDELRKATEHIGGPPAPDEPVAQETLAPPETPPTERTFGQKAGRLGLTIGGGLGGAALGTMVAPGLGTMVGGAAGAAAGSGLAETFDPSEHPIREAAIEAGTSAVGMKVAKTLGNILSPGAVREGGEELAGVMASRGLRPPVPMQYFDSKTVELMGTVGRASFIGAGSLDDAMQLGVKATRESAAEYAEQVQRSLITGSQMMNDVANQATQQGLKVDIRAVDNALRALAGKSPGNAELQNLSRLVSNIPGKSIPFNVTAEEAIARQAAATAASQQGRQVQPILNGAQDISSRLRKAARETSNDNEARLLGIAQKYLDDAMEASLKKGTPGLNEAWRAGKATYREGIQGKEIGDILNKSIISGGEAGEIGGKALMNQLKPNALKNLKTPLEPAQIQNLQRLARALEAAEGPNSRALTFVSNGIQISGVIRGMQGLAGAAGIGAAAAGSVATGGSAALIALTPAALAKVLASESTMKLMLALTRLPPGSAAAGRATTLLLAQLARERILTPDEVPTTAEQ